jgi:hypothetical protein
MIPDNTIFGQQKLTSFFPEIMHRVLKDKENTEREQYQSALKQFIQGL